MDPMDTGAADDGREPTTHPDEEAAAISPAESPPADLTAAPPEAPADPATSAPAPEVDVSHVSYDPSIDPGASFEKVAEAVFYRLPRWNGDPYGRAWHDQALPHRRDAFQSEYGIIQKEYFCENMVAAVALTSQDRVFYVSNEISEDASAVNQLFNEADRLQTEVRQFLQGDDLQLERRTMAEMIYSLVTHCLHLLDTSSMLDPDARARARSADAPQVGVMREDLAYARSYFERAVQRTAQLHYFKGMVWSAGTLYAVALPLGILVLTLLSDVRGTLGPILATFVAGATGAVISVLSRMTFDKISLDHTVGWSQLRYLGAFRPIIGAVLGVALFVVLAGGVITELAPEDPAQATYFYAGVAFVAGFSERWAQDMLSRGPAGGSGGHEGSET